jgi:hypothetical protein
MNACIRMHIVHKRSSFLYSVLLPPGSVAGWGTALQVGRSRVRFPIVSLEFFIDNPSGHTMVLGSTQPLTVMTTRDFVRFLLANYPASGVYMPTFRNTLFHLHRQVEVFPYHFLFLVHSTHIYLPMKMEQTECSETSAYKLQTPCNYPKEGIQHTEHGESLKSNTWDVSWRVRAAGAQGWSYDLHVPILLKSGSLNFLEPSDSV